MAYNAKPLIKLREKYQKKIDILVEQFGKEMEAEIKKQHSKKANQKDLICFEMGWVHITKYKTKEQFIADKTKYKEVDCKEFISEISELGYGTWCETGYGIAPIMPIFDGEQMENFLDQKIFIIFALEKRRLTKTI